VGLPQFDLATTGSVEETCALLHDSGPDTLVFAGGTDLFTKMKHRRLIPRLLINIKRIPGLEGIQEDERGGLRIGALTTIQAIEASNLVARKSPCLKQAAEVLGTLQVRNLGTIGGNLANASPSAEFAPPLLVLGASVRCAGRSAERLVPVESLFVGPGKTILRHDELITEVCVPGRSPGARCAYVKHSLRKMDVAIASAAVFVVLDGDVCSDVKIALGAVAPTPFRAEKAEQALKGQRLGGGPADTRLLHDAARLAAEQSCPIDDFRAYAAERRDMVATLVAKALERVLARDFNPLSARPV
jgi:carbon-monoxide dehydrogenase medium subunit